jgi:hypothetical protein
MRSRQAYELAVVVGAAPMKDRVWEFDLDRRWSVAFNGFSAPRGTSDAWARSGRAPLQRIPKYAIYLVRDKVPAGVVLQAPDTALPEPHGWLAAADIEARALDAIHRCAARRGQRLTICSQHWPQNASCARALRERRSRSEP